MSRVRVIQASGIAYGKKWVSKFRVVVADKFGGACVVADRIEVTQEWVTFFRQGLVVAMFDRREVKSVVSIGMEGNDETD